MMADFYGVCGECGCGEENDGERWWKVDDLTLGGTSIHETRKRENSEII